MDVLAIFESNDTDVYSGLWRGLWSSSLVELGKYTLFAPYSFARTLYYQLSESRLDWSSAYRSLAALELVTSTRSCESCV